MSQSEIQKLGIIDPNVDLSTSFKKWYTMFGGQNVSYIKYSTQSFSQTGMQFTIPLPNNTDCIIERESCIIKQPVTITLTGAGSGSGNIYQPATEGLRANPYAKITQNFSIIGNGNQISYNPYVTMPVKERYDANSNNKQITPSMCDYCQRYSDLYGTNKSPFALFNDNTHEPSRRSYPMTISSNTTTSAVLTTDLYTNLFDWAPFSPDDDVQGMNLVPLTMTWNYVSQLARIWSRDTTNNTQGALTAFSCVFGQPELHMRIMTLPSGYTIPRMVSYPYYSLVYYSTTYNSITAGATQDLQTNIIELQNVPSKIYIFATRSTNETLSNVSNAVTTPDCFMRPNSLQITMANKVALLSTCDRTDLMNISKRNGLNEYYSYADWVGNYGVQGVDPNSSCLPICIDPIRDLSLGSEYYVGKSTKINFQALLNTTSMATGTQNYDLGVLIVYDGIMTLDNGSMRLDLNLVQDKSELQLASESYRELRMVYGGDGGNAKSFFRNMWGKIKDVAKEVGPIINKQLKDSHILSNLAQNIPYVGPQVSTAIKTFGYGEDGGWIAGDGGDFYAGDGVLAGGKKMKRSTLQKNMQKHR